MPFVKFASVTMDHVIIPQSDEKTSQVITSDWQFTAKKDMLYVTVRAISARVNRNFDGFPPHELKKNAHTFVGRPVFVNHENRDHTRTRGMILDSKFKVSEADPADKYIELLIEVDAAKFPKLAKRILSGDVDSVSMGCSCEYTKCSACGNIARDWQDFCDHIPALKGKYVQASEDTAPVLVYEECRNINFFEISFVFDPADETAIFTNVITAIKKKAYGEAIAPAKVDTLRQDTLCPQCNQIIDEGKVCPLCGYEIPMDGFDDPDTSIAPQVDLRQEQGDDQVGNDPLNPNDPATQELQPSPDRPDIVKTDPNDPNATETPSAEERINGGSEEPVTGPANDQDGNPQQVDNTDLGERLPTLEENPQNDDQKPEDDDKKNNKLHAALEARKAQRAVTASVEENEFTVVEDLVLSVFNVVEANVWVGEVVDADAVISSKEFDTKQAAMDYTQEIANEIIEIANF